MTTDDYDKLVGLREEVKQAKRNLEEASKSWESAALQIARERNDRSVGTVKFERDHVKFECQGTGIYASQVWYEHYPVALLFDRMGVIAAPGPESGLIKLELLPDDGASFFGNGCDCPCKCRVTHTRRRAGTVYGPLYWCSHCWEKHKPQDRFQNAQKG